MRAIYSASAPKEARPSDDNTCFANFAGIGNKTDLDEVDFLAYPGRDPDTGVICIKGSGIEHRNH
jgi:acyl-CoA synthetase (NDP forming)